MQKVMNFFTGCYQAIAYIISPPICFSCKGYMQTRATLCPTCDQAIEFIAPKLFKINDRYLLTVYTVTRYTEPLRPMLFAKYRSDDIGIEKLADLIWEKSVLRQVSFDVLIPIPLHWTRILKRGFNQSEIVAERISKHSGIPVLKVLKRHRKTQYQVKVAHQDRVENVKKSMTIIDDMRFDLEGKHLMLVDDSCTTGATALEAAKLLVKYKPASINMIVACRSL